MNLQLLIPLLIATFTAIAGWFAVHWFSSKRDINNKRREIRINYLLEAYRKIERGSMPQAQLYNPADFESAISDIQLLGSPEQVRIAHEFAQQASSTGSNADLSRLLENLRNQLRNELKLETNELRSIRPFRIMKNKKSP